MTATDFMIDYDVNSLYAGSPIATNFTPVVFTPSIYSRRGNVLVINGPWAVDVDNDRALVWASDNNMDAFPVTMVTDTGEGEVEIHFATDDDAVVALLALA